MSDPIKEVAKRTANAKRYYYPERDHLTLDQGPNPTSVGYSHIRWAADQGHLKGFWDYDDEKGFTLREWEEDDGEA